MLGSTIPDTQKAKFTMKVLLAKEQLKARLHTIVLGK